MKNIKYLIILFGLCLIVACTLQDPQPASDLHDVSWTTDVKPGADYTKKQGEFITFVNLSQGALSEEFTIEEGNKFLKSGFQAKDSLQLFIDQDLGLKTSNRAINVLFNNPGKNIVKLRMTFKDSIAFPGNPVIPAVKENGVWVIEKIWNVEIYGKLKPAFKVSDKNGKELISVSAEQLVSITDQSKWPTVEVEAGDFLIFEDLTTVDRPTGGTWTINSGKPNKVSGKQIAQINFFTLGTSNAGSFTSSRNAPLPVESVVKLIPLKIKVIPSTQPFVFTGTAIQNEDNSISFGVTGEVASLAGKQANFKVHVTNGAFDQDLTVSSAIIDPADATKIILKTTTPTYNSDVITISYNGVGGVQSVDSRTLAAFTDKVVTNHFGNSLLDPSQAGFETVYSSGNQLQKGDFEGYFIGTANNTFPYFYRATNQVFAGLSSLKYENPNGVNNVLLQGTFRFQSGLDAGKYFLSYMVYLEPGNTMLAFTSGGAAGLSLTSSKWDLSTLERGKWVKITQVVTVNSPIAATASGRLDLRMVSSDNVGVVGLQKMYFDETKLVRIDTRP
jgi:hypothetical protein